MKRMSVNRIRSMFSRVKVCIVIRISELARFDVQYISVV